MANRYLQQFYQGFNHLPVYMDCNFTIDSAQTTKVKLVNGGGIKTVAQLSTGVYQVTLQDSYNDFLTGAVLLQSPLSGSAVASNALSANVVYTITVLGTVTTADWQSAGLPLGVTPAVGVTFLATGGTTGTSGSAQTSVTSGIVTTELIGVPKTTTNNPTNSYLVIKTLGATSTSVTTPIATNPVDGTVVRLYILMRNSSVTSHG